MRGSLLITTISASLAAVATSIVLASGAADGQGRSPQPGVTRVAIIQAEAARAAAPDQLQLLTTAATRPSPLQAIAVRAIGRLERLDQIPTLLPLLDAKEPRVRAEAARELGRWRTPQALELLQQIGASAEDEELRHICRCALKGIEEDLCAIR